MGGQNARISLYSGAKVGDEFARLPGWDALGWGFPSILGWNGAADVRVCKVGTPQGVVTMGGHNAKFSEHSKAEWGGGLSRLQGWDASGGGQ